MGAYLSEPVTEKLSVDKSCERLCFGASSMQGWRVSQEDAHNCELDFDANTSLFAVYDGHGGAEVAQYCAMNLPKFIKETETYKSGNIAQALEDAFLAFDGTLIRQDVLAELKQMAGDNGQQSDCEDNEIDNLHAEAHMPIEELLAKYRTNLTSNGPKYLRKETRGIFLRPQSSDCTAGPSGSSTDHSPTKTDAEKSDSGSGGDSSKQEVVTNGVTEKEETTPMKETDYQLEEKPVSNGSSSTTNAESATSSAVLKDKGLKGILGSAIKISKADVMATCSKILSPILQRKGIPRSARPLLMEDESDESDETDDDDFNGPKSSEDDDDDDDNDDSVDENGDDEDGEVESESEDEDNDDDDDEEEEDLADGNEEFVLAEKEEPGFDSGCTAVVAILRNDELYVANAGDSRCVVCRAGKAIEMSHDHKPEDELERQRIENAGGKVTMDGRVNGGLNLSRAIGDHSYKNNEKVAPRDQMISALPDIRTLTIEPEDDEFMVIACDGIWNFMSSQQVIDFIRERLTSDRKNISSICEELFDKCLSPTTMGDGTGCDNMTCIIVKFCQLPSKSASAKRSSDSEDVPDSKRAKLDNDESLDLRKENLIEQNTPL